MGFIIYFALYMEKVGYKQYIKLKFPFSLDFLFLIIIINSVFLINESIEGLD